MSVKSPVDKMIELDFAKIPAKDAYKILIGAIVPRPIAFVSTISVDGVGNLAPFSFFNGVSSDPPTLMFAVSRKSDGTKKDTQRNIEATRGFVVNSVASWIAEPMNLTSAAYPYGVDEMEKVGLTPLPSTRVKARRVKESPIQMECELYKTLEVGPGDTPGSATIIVGKILCVHIHAPAYQNGRIVLKEIEPVSRLAGTSYGLVSGVFDLERPKA